MKERKNGRGVSGSASHVASGSAKRLALAATGMLFVSVAFWHALVDAATNWDTVVTPVASSYLSLRTSPPFAYPDGLATLAPTGSTPTPSTSSSFGDWEARYNYYPASQQLACDPATYNSATGCTGVNPQGYNLTTRSAWLARFGFVQRKSGETLDAYRRRAHVAVYYNENELGLGRELGCTTFVDRDSAGNPIATPGLACYISNYGEAYSDFRDAMSDAIVGLRRKNTVCISYQPSLPADYQVQFYVFAGDEQIGSDEQLKPHARLDVMGSRPMPHICTTCHGGIYDAAKHLVRNARFLPLNVSDVRYADTAPYTRSDENDPIRYIHDLIYRTDIAAGGDTLLTRAQSDSLLAMYGMTSSAATSIPPGTLPNFTSVPAGWSKNSHTADLYRYAIRPYCASCHDALSTTQNPVLTWKSFKANWDSIGTSIGDFSMPHAQPTLAKFWGAYLTSDGTPAGQPVLLAPDGTPWKSARNLLVYTMELGSNPNPTFPGPGCTDSSQCGDTSDSGRACVDSSCRDQCSGGVGCPGSTGLDGLNVQECRNIVNDVGMCVSCGRLGQTPCAGSVCNEGTNSNGICL